MIRDEDGALTGYVYLDLKTQNYGGFVSDADKLLRSKLDFPAVTPIAGPANMSSSCVPRSG